MNKLVQLWRRLLFYLRRDRFDRELEEEMRFHLEMKAEENLAAGVSTEEARYAAQRQFGNQTLLQEVSRDMWGFRSLETLAQDIRYGLRMMLKQPGFTLIATLTLALGIGATTAIFSVVNGVLLRGVPYKDDERIVTFWQTRPGAGVQREDASPANFLDWHARAQSCETIAAAEPFGHSLIGNGEPESFRSWIVTAGFFEALGVQALHGRTFLPEEYRAGNTQVVVLGYGLWQSRFGGDPGLVGQKLTLSRQPFTVVGVMPPEFQYPPGRDLWAPRAPRESDAREREATYIKVVGRLKPGRTVEQARAEMNAIAAQLAQEYPQTNSQVGALVTPLREYLVGQTRQMLLMLSCAVGAVLLIVCVNVAGLLLARAAERQREFAIRAALGAERSRLTRQMLIEGLLLAAAGGTCGVLLSWWLVKLIVTFAAGSLPRLGQVSVSGPVLVFATLVSVLAALIASLVPALQLARPDLQKTLRQEGSAATRGPGRLRFRNALVISEIALAMLLLVSAGLLARSFITLLRVDPGFVTDRALTLEVQLEGRLPAPEQRRAFVEQTLEKLKQLPGVSSAGGTSAMPFHDNQINIPTPLQIADHPQVAGQEPTAFIISVTPDYPRTLGASLLRGRELNQFDKADAAPVALINEALAKRHWPAEEPLGKKITFQTFGRTVTCEIVGVLGDVRPSGFDSDPRPEVFLPYAQSPAGAITYLVRTARDPLDLASAIKGNIREVNPNQTFSSVATLEELIDRSISQRRLNLLLLSSFAILALSLAGVGLYGLISFTTAQRTHEIGVRLALGAQTADVVKLIIRQGMRLVSVGVGIGLIGALAVTRLMKTMLFGVSATDPLTFTLIVSLLTIVALLACWIPARRATKVDPMTALRFE